MFFWHFCISKSYYALVYFVVELMTYVSAPAQYLVVIKGLNDTTSNLRLLVRSKERSDVVLDEIETQSSDTSTLFTMVQLNTTSHLLLQWNGDAMEEDHNRTSLYKVDPSSYTITNKVNKDFVMKPSNRTSRRLGNWVRSHNFGNELDFDYQRGLFVAKQPAEYIVLVNARTIAKKDEQR